MKDIAIIGAGAAGLATAIFTARRDPTLSILLLDGAKKIGAKILVSGGGRCNVTNDVVTPADYSGGSRNSIRRILQAFPVDATVEFFREIGVPLHREDEGKLFPNSNKSRSVLEALLAEVRKRGIDLKTEHRVEKIEQNENGFEISTSQGPYTARKLVLATGGKALPKSGSDGAGYQMAKRLGHQIIEPIPALVPLTLKGSFHSALSGIAHPVRLTVRAEGEKPIQSERAMLWTHFGISGPAPMDLSRAWLRPRGENRSVTMTASFLENKTASELDSWFLSEAKKRPTASVHKALSKQLPARLVGAILTREEIPEERTFAHLGKEERKRLVRALCEWPIPLSGSRGYNFAEVTAGGVPLSEIDPKTMASRTCPGLYLTGEIIDVDGKIGGFNFQWAWSTGWVAGAALAGA